MTNEVFVFRHDSIYDDSPALCYQFPPSYFAGGVPALPARLPRGGGHRAGKARERLMRAIRPTANALAGYVPSYVMGRGLDEEG